MSLELKAGPTSLERLETAIGRMVQKHGFVAVDREQPDFPAGLAVLLLTEDPQRNPEVLDACVILPEALKALGETVARHVAGPAVGAPLLARYGVARAPAVVFLRDGEALGVLQGIRDWQDYRAEVERLSRTPAGTAMPRAIPIPVRVDNAKGACA